MRCLSVIGDCSSCVMNWIAQDEKHILGPSFRYVEDEAGFNLPIFTEQKVSLHVRNHRQFDEFGKGEFYNHLLT